MNEHHWQIYSSTVYALIAIGYALSAIERPRYKLASAATVIHFSVVVVWAAVIIHQTPEVRAQFIWITRCTSTLVALAFVYHFIRYRVRG